MAHYIDADRLREAIDAQRQKLVITLYEIEDDKMEIRVKGMHDAFVDSLALIDSLQQEQPKLTQVPRIEQETQKKGWLDYGLLISEIGLHRSNAIDRIKATKERATEIKRNMAPHDLAILGEYLESAGAEIVLCCLQRYCMDFMFTQDEVKEIIQQEQPEVDLEQTIHEKVVELHTAPSYDELRDFALYFYEMDRKTKEDRVCQQ